MYYLGISGGWPPWHDSAAALIENGKIIAAAEEERFTNFKHAPAQFPTNAIKFCLQEAGIKITDVDKFCYFLKPNLLTSMMRGNLYKPLIALGSLAFYNNFFCRES